MLVAIPVIALAAAGVSVNLTSTAAAKNGHPRYQPTGNDYYINYVEPKVERQSDGKEVTVDKVRTESGTVSVKQPAVDHVKAYDQKFSSGNPRAARVLAKR